MTIEEALDKLKTSKFRGRFKLTAADVWRNGGALRRARRLLRFNSRKA